MAKFRIKAERKKKMGTSFPSISNSEYEDIIRRLSQLSRNIQWEPGTAGNIFYPDVRPEGNSIIDSTDSLSIPMDLVYSDGDGTTWTAPLRFPPI